MPAKTAKQQKFMGACAHGAGYKNCPPQDVAEEFAHKPAGGYKGGKTTNKGHQSVHSSKGWKK